MCLKRLDNFFASKSIEVYANSMRTIGVLLWIKNAETPQLYWLYTCTGLSVQTSGVLLHPSLCNREGVCTLYAVQKILASKRRQTHERPTHTYHA